MDFSVSQVAVFAWFAIVGATRSLIVRARAGCGKTTTIVEGIRTYVRACLAVKAPIRVLATSFAKKITVSLAERLADLKSVGVDVRSLNSLGNSFSLGKLGYRVKLDDTARKFDIARAMAPDATPDAIACLAKLHTKCRALLPLATCGAELEGLAEQFDLGPTDDMVNDGWTLSGLCEAAYDCMVAAARHVPCYDFADQVFLPLRNGWTRPMYDRIVVDETQDMDPAQLLLAQRSLRVGGSMCVVGDDMQAIYGFRGADTTAIDRLKSELDATEIGLACTYRCPRLIVDMARNLTPSLADFTSADGAPDGMITTNLDIVGMIEAVKPGDFILSRSNAPLVPLCLALLRRGTRAYVAGRDIGATLIAVVKRLKITEIDQLSSALAAYTAKKVEKISKDKKAIDGEWLAAKLDSANDESETILAIADGCLSIAEIVSRLSTLFADDTAGAVMLSTVHKAKGLEAVNVFLCDGTFRYKSHDDLMIRYVAITRAKSTLHMVSGFEKTTEVSLAA